MRRKKGEMTQLLKSSFLVLTVFLPLRGDKAFLQSLDNVRCHVHVNDPHFQDGVSALCPHQKVALLFRINRRPWWVVG